MTHSIDTPTGPPQSGATPVTGGTSTTGSASTTDVAKDEARNVGQTAAQAGSQVASTAADQAKQVTYEAKNQAQALVQQGRSQVREQARTGQQKAGQGLSDIASQLRVMVEGGETPSGPAADLVRQAGDKLEEIANWVQQREPGDLVEEVRRYARRRPGMFLIGAALAGVAAGRLTTGVVAAHKDSDSGSGQQLTGSSYPSTYATDTNYIADTPATGYASTGTVGYGAGTTGYGTTTGQTGVAGHSGTAGYESGTTGYETGTTGYESGTTGTTGYESGTAGYGTTGTSGTLPPPPYGTSQPEGTEVPPSTSGWDDPASGSGQQ